MAVVKLKAQSKVAAKKLVEANRTTTSLFTQLNDSQENYKIRGAELEEAIGTTEQLRRKLEEAHQNYARLYEKREEITTEWNIFASPIHNLSINRKHVPSIEPSYKNENETGVSKPSARLGRQLR